MVQMLLPSDRNLLIFAISFGSASSVFSLGTPTDPALSLGTLQAGNRLIRQSHTLLLRNRSQDANHCYFKDACAVQQSLCERSIVDPLPL